MIHKDPRHYESNGIGRAGSQTAVSQVVTRHGCCRSNRFKQFFGFLVWVENDNDLVRDVDGLHTFTLVCDLPFRHQQIDASFAQPVADGDRNAYFVSDSQVQFVGRRCPKTQELSKPATESQLLHLRDVTIPCTLTDHCADPHGCFIAIAALPTKTFRFRAARPSFVGNNNWHAICSTWEQVLVIQKSRNMRALK